MLFSQERSHEGRAAEAGACVSLWGVLMRHLIALVAAALIAPGASATTITFTEVPLANGAPVTNQYASFGITAANFYYYSGNAADTFDGTGLFTSNLTGPGSINFAAPIASLSVDYLVLATRTIVLNTVDSSGNVIESFSFTAGASNVNATHDFTIGGIKTLVGFSQPIETFMGVSALRFDGVAPVPEPGTWAMMLAGFGLAGAAARRARRPLSFALALG